MDRSDQVEEQEPAQEIHDGRGLPGECWKWTGDNMWFDESGIWKWQRNHGNNWIMDINSICIIFSSNWGTIYQVGRKNDHATGIWEWEIRFRLRQIWLKTGCAMCICSLGFYFKQGLRLSVLKPWILKMKSYLLVFCDFYMNFHRLFLTKCFLKTKNYQKLTLSFSVQTPGLLTLNCPC